MKSESTDFVATGEDGCGTRSARARRLRVAMGLLIPAVLITAAHRLIYPWPIFLQGDQVQSVEAAIALEAEGKLLVPFDRTRSVHIRSGFIDTAEIARPIRLEDDLRELHVCYPPGYSLLVAAGIRTGLSPANACLALFYINMFLGASFWLGWARRVGLPGWWMIVALMTMWMGGPTTVTDSYYPTLAGALFLIGTLKPGIRSNLCAAVVMTAGVLMRYAAIVMPAAWVLWSLMSTRKRSQWMLALSASVIPVSVDLAIKLLRVNKFVPLRTSDEIAIPTLTEMGKAVYYAIMGGWSPTLVPLKAVAASLAVIVLAAAVYLAIRGRLRQWESRIVAFQLVNGCFLMAVQLRSGTVFSQAPITINRYWAPAAFGILCLWLSILSRANPGIRRLVVPGFGLFLLASTATWIHESHQTKNQRIGCADGFSRKPDDAWAIEELRKQPLSAVLTDLYTCTFRAVDPKIIKSAQITKFSTATGGTIAVVYSGDPTNQAVRRACTEHLDLLRRAEFSERRQIEFFRIEAGTEIQVHSEAE